MRIGIVAHHVAPIAPPFAGGVESHTYYLARWLARRGHEVVLYGLEGSAVEGVEVRPLEAAFEVSAAARRDVSMPPAAFMAAHCAYQSLMLALQARREHDVLHLQALHYLPVLMAPLPGVPAVLTLHCPPTPWLEAALRSPAAGAVIPTAVSQATARQWAPIARAAVIANGVDGAAWPAGPGGTGAIWSGRMVPEKAPHLAIAAARRAGLTLDMAGPVYDQAYFDTHVRPALGPDVRYAGHLSHTELARAVGASGVALVTPDWEEPFGLVAAEAMATGTPVAAFARGGLTDVVGAEGGRLAPPGDVDALAAAALYALSLDRGRVRRSALARLGIDAMGAAYEALFARALGGRRGALRSAA